MTGGFSRDSNRSRSLSLQREWASQFFPLSLSLFLCPFIFLLRIFSRRTNCRATSQISEIPAVVCKFLSSPRSKKYLNDVCTFATWKCRYTAWLATGIGQRNLLQGGSDLGANRLEFINTIRQLACTNWYISPANVNCSRVEQIYKRLRLVRYESAQPAEIRA